MLMPDNMILRPRLSETMIKPTAGQILNELLAISDPWWIFDRLDGE
jgi:hypothetical protein